MAPVFVTKAFTPPLDEFNEYLMQIWSSHIMTNNGPLVQKLEDEIMRGYTDEMRDFMDAIYFDREPKSGLDIAYETVQITYAAYKSSELGVAVKP